ncbi:MAG: YafY family transcriptional regulator [Colwellia sp.]|nr:YafY family transcriptional regulator [Colwellia sp.]
MRSSRLLQLLQILRRHRLPVSGHLLANELGVSIRTLYRDIATLQVQGAEIEGEAGVGYILKSGFFLPPLMLTQDEIEALMLGIRWVSTFGDQPLALSAKNALAKITAVLPPETCDGAGAVPLRIGSPIPEHLLKEDLSNLRKAIRLERKLEIDYQDKQGHESTRIIWPFAIGYFPQGRILAAWCETRQDYRHFQTENITLLQTLAETYPRRRSQLFKEWHALQKRNSTD